MFIKKLVDRRVPQILGSYFIGATTLIFFIDWLVVKYEFSEYYTSLALFGLICIIPSVIILAYFHGAPGKDEWTKVEKFGIPINIVFIAAALYFGYTFNYFEEVPPDHSKVYDSFLVNIKSTQQYIDNYKKTPAFDEVSTFVDSIYPITNSRLTEIQGFVYAKLRQEFIHHDIDINFAETSKEKEMLNELISMDYIFYLLGLEDSLSKKKTNNIEPLYFEILDYFNKKHNTHIDFILNIDVMEAIPSLKGKILMIDTHENTTVVGFRYVSTSGYTDDDGERLLFFESVRNNIYDVSHIEDDDIKDPIFESLSNNIKDFSFGEYIGVINSILDTDLVTIKLNKPELIRGTQLINLSREYLFQEKNIEATLKNYTADYKTIHNFFTQHPESIENYYTELDLDSLDYGGKSNLLNWYKIEIDSLEENYQNIVNEYQNQKYEEVIGFGKTEFRYYLKILTVQDSIATAKVTGKLFPFTQPQIGDKINIK
ncbi:MAG: hypothetical protein H8E85_04630 [Candidatus Marinimicrobia bacterium]|nr:hypothetical protein [Candidatus Neomarinimicrobiota bacterium]